MPWDRIDVFIERPVAKDAKLDMPLESLEWTVLPRKAFRKLGLETIGDLVKKTEEELLLVKNFGMTSLMQVRDKLAAIGLRLRERCP